MSKYIVKGSVRGLVSKHNTLAAAVRSLAKDQRDCRSLGGGAYSDCEIERTDGEELSADEVGEIERLTYRE